MIIYYLRVPLTTAAEAIQCAFSFLNNFANYFIQCTVFASRCLEVRQAAKRISVYS